ncbi:MAG: cyclic nucleotide-binding domain-containing protein [Pseudomonadota bacterium]
MMTDVFGATVAEQLSPPRVYVHLALLFYVIGFLTRDELILRVQVLVGTVFYGLYYFFIAPVPLWEAILGSVAIGAANIYSSIVIMRERSTFGMSQKELQLYAHFTTLRPGHFRRIMRKADWIRIDADTVLLEEGGSVEKLYFVQSGSVQLKRGNKVSSLGPGHFLGELAFLTNSAASASVIADNGAEVIAWDQAQLRKIMDRSPTISNAIVALFNKDLARKLAVSWPEAVLVTIPSADGPNCKGTASASFD